MASNLPALRQSPDMTATSLRARSSAHNPQPASSQLKSAMKKPTALDKRNANDSLPRNNAPAPSKPKHLHYRDHEGVSREIWQPGDNDGERDSEFLDKSACTARWRFFQSKIGPIVRGTNSPPHYVVLDDKAAWDILSSGVYTLKEKGQFWPFDFAVMGHIRSGRPNRGRPAIVDAKQGEFVDTGDGQGARCIAWCMAGDRKSQKKYHFVGERRGYTETIFSSAVRGGSADRELKRKANEPEPEPRHKRPRTGPYVHSAPSPPRPSYERRAVVRAGGATRGVFQDGDNTYNRSEWSTQATAGRRTAYATMPGGFDEPFPDRINGRMVGAQTPYTGYSIGARTPYLASSARSPYPGMASGGTTRYQYDPRTLYHSDGEESWNNTGTVWQKIRAMETEFGKMRTALKARDDEISHLRGQLEASGTKERFNAQQMREALKVRSAEVAKLKQELQYWRNTQSHQ